MNPHEFGHLSAIKDETFVRRAFLIEEASHRGWVFGGPVPGAFWFHLPTWGGWQNAMARSGTKMEPKGPDAHPALYGTIDELAEGEDFRGPRPEERPLDGAIAKAVRALERARVYVTAATRTGNVPHRSGARETLSAVDEAIAALSGQPQATGKIRR